MKATATTSKLDGSIFFLVACVPPHRVWCVRGRWGRYLGVTSRQLFLFPRLPHMDAPVAPGDVLLGKYRVERVLGKGGMGIVVAARHVDLGQLYAIKFLLPAMLGHRESLERFLREARAAARLQSEYVARVHDVGRMENGAPYMVMEYLDGCDLKAWLKQYGALPVEAAVGYVLQLCDAIAEAHELGIVHRDLKPANLFMVRRRNGSQCVKVLDFGISKHTGPEELDLTNTNAMFGSPLYMSPEQMVRTKTVDTRTDIWAIGVILYELLAGKSPFKAETMTEVVSRVLQEEPVPLRELRPEVPPGVEAVIARCLRKRREERFQTVGELSAALSPFGALPTVRGPMASGASLEVATGYGAAAPQTVTLPLLPLPARETPAATIESTTAAWGATRATASRRTRVRPVWVAVGVMLAAVVGIALWFVARGSSGQEVAPAASAVASQAMAEAPAASEAPAAPTTEKPASGPESTRPVVDPLPVATEASTATAPNAAAPTAAAPPVPVATPGTAQPTSPKLAPPAPSPSPASTATTKKRRGVL